MFRSEQVLNMRHEMPEREKTLNFVKIDKEMKPLPAGRVVDLIDNHQYRAIFFGKMGSYMSTFYFDGENFYFNQSDISNKPTHYAIVEYVNKPEMG